MLLFIAVAGNAAGEPVELSDLDQAVSLAVMWKFQPGDNAGWAAPDYDHSGWRTIRIPTGFGRDDASGELAWYRLEIQVGPPGRGPTPEERADLRLALTIGKVDSAYEVFAGGVRLGGVGAMPPSPRMDYDRHGIYPVPPQAVDSEGRLVVALRVWKSPQTWSEIGGPHEGPFLLGREANLTRQQMLSELPAVFLAGLFMVVGLFHLELYRRRPQLPGYLWFFGCSTAFAAYSFLRTQWKYQLSDNFLLLKEVEYLMLFLLVAGFIQLVWPLLGLRIGRLLRAYQLLNVATGVLVAATPGVWLNMLVLPYWELSLLGLIVHGLWTIFRQAWSDHPEARIVAVGTIGSALAFLNDIGIDRGLIVGTRLVAFGFGFLILCLALSLANRFMRIHRELLVLRDDLERRVKERTQQLLEASQAKSRFLATMSHEIRTPLNGVIGLTELLLKTELAPEQRRYAEMTRDSGDILLTLIDDILDFSKIEAVGIGIKARPFRVREVVEQSVQLLAPKAAQAGIDLTLAIEPAVPEAVVGDPDRLRQILINLVGNAVKFTEEGEVRVGVDAGDGELRFRVADTGIGIPKDSRRYLFDPFTQVDGSDSRLHGGTGLGLAICRRLCAAMGGSIWLESEVGRGSTFYFTIRAAPADAPEVFEPPRHEAPRHEPPAVGRRGEEEGAAIPGGTRS